jgi:CubicO group peptidase (beta-lactamase class C family)
LDSATASIARHATGYAARPDGFTKAPPMNVAFLSGAGDLYSTTGDLLRWTQGVYGGRLLSATALKKMTTPFKEPFGMGIAIVKASVGTVKDITVLTHDGNVYGFSSSLAYLPEEKITIAVLANVDGRHTRSTSLSNWAW